MKYFSIFLFLTTCFLSHAQEERKEVVSFEDAYKRTYHTTRLDGEKPKIDGRLDEDFWKNKGEWSEKFSQVIPFERVHTKSWTRMKIFYDDENIYIGVYCKDEHPEEMNAFIGNRDDNSNGDLISVAFDTYHDYRVAPEFNINLGGNKTDLTVTDKLSVNLSWNAVWEGRTHIDMVDSSWTAELRIPFSQLRYNRENRDGIWGLHVRRIIRRNNEVQNWSLIPIKNNGHVFSFGEMHGMKDLPRPKGIEFLPHVLGKYSFEPSGSTYQNSLSGSTGLDARAAIGDFTLDLTINPDYGQVELDPSVMNLSAYETFYDEKRPFFLEGKHILEFDKDEEGMMFYSRRIGAAPTFQPENADNPNISSAYVPILGALKLTGTNKKGMTAGILQSVTGQTSTTAGGEKIRTEPLTNYTVARLQKNWDGNTLLGGMVTSVNRHLAEEHLKSRMVQHALTGGLDFTRYFANRLYYIDAKGMFSSLHGTPEAILHTKRNATHYYHRESAGYLDEDTSDKNLNGTGGYIKIGKRGNAQWNFSQIFNWASPGFDLNDIGYLKESDYLSNESEVVFRKTDPWGPFRFAGINLTQKNMWNYGGTAINNDIGIRWRSLSIKRRMVMDIRETFSWNTIDSRRLRGGPDVKYNANFETKASFNTDRARRTVFKIDYYGRHFIDQNTGYNDIHPGMIFRIGNHILLTGQLDYAWNKDALQYVNTSYTTENKKPVYIMGSMDQKTYGLTLNMQLNLTPDFSIQYYGSPFTSIARYDQFKLAANTLSSDYKDRITMLDPQKIRYENGHYTAEHEGWGIIFPNPDFSFNEFRSNLVVRWEYLPGSTIYLVWEHQRSERENRFFPGWGNNIDRLTGMAGGHTIMMKINYWIGM